MSALHAYTSHVVRNVCCSGGQLCPIGRLAMLMARTDEKRAEYLDQAETLGIVERLLRERGPGHNGYFVACLHWTGLDVDAASIALDLATAEESIERTRRGVAWA